MKKKIVTSVIITVIFALAIITTSFLALASIKEIENTKSILFSYNNVLALNGEALKNDFNVFNINGEKIRFTIINKEGKVIFDSLGEIKENYNKRKEIIEARESGKGYENRYSNTLNTDMVYVATKLDDGTIIRSGIPEYSIKIFFNENMKYYGIVLIIVFILSIALALKLVRIIIDPVKHLEYVTSKIANGNLQTRVNVTSKDELGELGKTFNNMADQLQNKINEATDKQNRLEAILNSMESGVIAIDNSNNIITINPYAKKIFGIHLDVTGKSLKEAIKDEKVIELLESDSDNEIQIKIKNPVNRFLKVKKATVITGYKKIGRVIAIQDITEMKRLENIRSQFVANVSHELKTPLTSIKGFAETLKYVDDTETRNKFLDIIDSEAVRLTRLINDILVLSNLESNMVEEMEEFLPDDIIEEVINILRSQCIKKNIKVHFESLNTKYILGQRDKFHQVAMNIIENSIKYSKEDKDIYIKTFFEDGYFNFIVKDNGIGIPKEDLPRIFERFYRVDKARKSGGTGLGLAIVKHIIKGFGGNIFVNSDIDKGSEFIVKIKKI